MKRICCAMLTLLTAGHATTAESASVPPVSAAAGLQSHLLARTVLSAEDAAAADADGNGTLNAIDLTLRKRALLSAPSRSYAGLCINEVCSSNHDSYAAPDGSSPDWVELYNSGSSPYVLSGCGLSDRASDRYRFVFPENTVIPAYGFLLVLCDGTGSPADLHTPFKLSASGESVFLTAPESADGSAGSTIDSVTVPALDTDITYGRLPDGGTWTTLHASAGRPNTEAEPLHMISAPVFSKAAGFYDDPFDLTLTAASGFQILYTTDGSDPRASDTAAVYSTSLPICDNTEAPNRVSAVGGVSSLTDYIPAEPVDKGMVIRAVCRDAEGSFSKVITNGYFIGKTASYYKELRVISLSTDPEHLFDQQSGIYLQKNCMNRGKEWERPVHMQVFENGIVRYSEDVGARIAGNWSRNYPQKSLTFYARSEYGASKMKYDFFGGTARDCNGSTIKEFDKVTLRNGGDGYDALRFRDDLNAYLANGLAISTQTKYDYVVFIDGEFWGCYSMQEKLDDEYLEAHYHVPKENITTIKNTLGEGDETVCQDYAEFYAWAKDADMTQEQNYQHFCEKMDVQSLIDFIVAESIICNWDSLVNVNNTMIWRAVQTDSSNPYADGKWRFLFFDTEYSSGFSGTGADYNFLAEMDRSDQINCFGTLFYQLIQNDTFAAQFRTSYERALQQNFTAERASAQIDSYLTRLTPVYLATAKRFGFSMDENRLNTLTDSLRDFWNRRGAYAMAQCEACLENRASYRGD